MQCYIYKSPVRKQTYLYLSDKDDFSMLPEALLSLFGEPEFSFDFNLSADKKLFQEDVTTVRTNLQGQGYHLQMPEKDIESLLAEMAE